MLVVVRGRPEHETCSSADRFAATNMDELPSENYKHISTDWCSHVHLPDPAMPCGGSYSSRHACDDVRIVNRHSFGNSHFAPLAVLTHLSPWEQLQTTDRGETARRQKNRQRNTLAVKQIELIAIAKAFQYAKVTLTLLDLTSDIQTLSRQL